MSSSKPLHILAIVPYPFLPPTSGGDFSTVKLFNHLGAKNKVTLLTCTPFSKIDHLHFNFALLPVLKFIPSRYVNLFALPRLLRIIRQQQTDIIFLEQPWYWFITFFLRLFSGKKVVMRANNLEYTRFRSMNKWWWRILYAYEKWAQRSADFVFFVSDDERQQAIKKFGIAAADTMVTPYGVEVNSPKTNHDTERSVILTRHKLTANDRILLFFGALDYAPNAEAVFVILDKILPLLKRKSKTPYKFILCGRKASDEMMKRIGENPDVIYAGFVDDIEHYISAAHVVLNPIMNGGGIKTKAVDALAQNKTVISTRTGALGIDVQLCGQNLLLADDGDWNTFTDLIITYTNHQPVMPNSFYSFFSWTGITDNMGAQMRKLL